MSAPGKRKIAYFHLLRTAWEYAGERRKTMATFYGMFIFANALNLLQPYAIGKVFNALQQGGPAVVAQSVYWVAIYVIIFLFFWAFHGPARVAERQLGFWVRKNFSDRLYRTVSELPMSWHQDHHSGNTINRLTKAGNALSDFTEHQFQWIEIALNFIGPMVAVTLIDPVLGVVLVVVAALTFLGVAIFDKWIIPLLHEENHHDHIYAATLFDYVSNIATVLTLRLERLTARVLDSRLLLMFPPMRRHIALSESKWFTMNIMVTLGEVSVPLIYIIRHHRAGEVIAIGAVAMLYQYTRRLWVVFDTFTSLYNSTIRRGTHVHSIAPILEAHARLARKAPPELPEHWQHIQIGGLGFSYEDRKHEKHTLRNLNLEWERGQTVALIGTSGAGKSTLLACLRGLYEADRGVLTVDGKACDGVAAVASISTLIPQDPEIFEDTIRYNITVGVEHTEDEILEAVRLAHFDDVLAQLDKGLETDIREKGVNLSGGQKQRLALARGIFAARHANSSLLLLDEPTSSVDSRTEAEIYRRLFSSQRDIALIASVHRLHFLPQFDRIYWIERGEIIAQGSFEELMANNARFVQLWQEYHQAHPEE